MIFFRHFSCSREVGGGGYFKEERYVRAGTVKKFRRAMQKKSLSSEHTHVENGKHEKDFGIEVDPKQASACEKLNGLFAPPTQKKVGTDLV